MVCQAVARVSLRRRGNIRGVKFRPRARLDTGQVQDRRGMGGGRGIAVGGGAGGLLLVVVLLLLGVNPTGGGGDGSDPFALGTGQGTASDAGELSSTCRTGEDANQREDCRIVAVVNSVQAYWGDNVQGYREAPTQFFTGQTQTGCGGATSAVGPFYCPSDQTVYIDLGFYRDLRTRFGARGGRVRRGLRHRPRVRPPRPAPARHGPARRATTAQGATSGSVRLELQADCYAGVWAAHAVDTGFVEQLTAADVADGLDAAAAVGDDRIQKAATGRVDPESLDPRVVRAAPEVVRHRLPHRRREPLRHVRRRRALIHRTAAPGAARRRRVCGAMRLAGPQTVQT